MKKLTSTFFLLVTIILKAQTPYELFNSKSELFFNQPDVESELLGLKPDSVKLNDLDSLYFHYRILGQVSSSSCPYTAHYPSWLGYKTIRKLNNDYVFFNQQNDSLIIKTSAQVNSSWNYYTYSNGDYIKATVTSKQYEATFNGLFDTVKTISFQAYNNSNNPILNDYNGKTFKIARDQGIIKLGNIYNFPTDTAINYRCYGKRLRVHDLTDHNIGEVLQTYQFNGYYFPPPSALVRETYLTYSYVDKVNPTANSVTYTVNLTVQSHTLSPSSATSTATSTETITFNNLDSFIVDRMPQQYYSFTSDPSSEFGSQIRYYYNPATNNYCGDNFKIQYLDCFEYGGSSDSCLGVSVSCVDPKYVSFISGLHAYPTYYIQTLNSGNNPFQQNIVSYPVYSNAAGSICGSMVVMNSKELENKSSIILYPNPSHATLFISSSSNFHYIEINIFNIEGKLVLSGNSSEINISNLNQGVYFVKIKTDQGELSRKFVKE